MGNTKYIAFQGNIFNGEKDSFSEQTLLESAHGDHVAVKVFPCYLHYDGKTPPDNKPFVIGHLTTHSMSGFAVVDHIVKHMHSGHVIKTDVDWGDCSWLTIEDRAVKETFKVDF